MNTKLFAAVALLIVALLIVPAGICAEETKSEELKPIQLLSPQTEGGKSLMQALKERKSTREFSSTPLPPQVLSDLLWAAFGINRPESGKRTAPSSSNRQEIDIYAALAGGLYFYQAEKHILTPVLAVTTDQLARSRAETGTLRPQEYSGQEISVRVFFSQPLTGYTKTRFFH